MAIPPVRSQGDSGHIQDHNDIGTELAARLPLSGGTLTGALNGTSATFTGAVSGASGSFTGTVTAATPTANGHLATKQYVDSQSISIPGITAGYITTVTVTFDTSVPPYPDIACQKLFSVTFPSGRFTSAPAVSGGSARFRGRINGFASSTSSVTMSYQNLDSVTLGPGLVPSDQVQIMAIQGA